MNGENITLKEAVLPENPMKQWLVNYVGETYSEALEKHNSEEEETIDWDGSIFQCCEYVVRTGVDPYTVFKPEKSNIAEIWNGPVARKHREIHLTEGRGGIDICAECPRTGTAFKY